MAAVKQLDGTRIHVTGIVQGVGFRPFVYALANRLHLTGWVCNTSAGVDIEVCGTSEAIAEFTRALESETPPLARIDSVEVSDSAGNGYTTFEIIPSRPIAGAFQPISPDKSICADCLHELFQPGDRRYRYPFINCTNCGPRFTLIEDIPYDRPNTTMAPFAMCPECRREYNDPLDRRFHAQPIACPACGPRIWLEESGDNGRPGASGEPSPHNVIFRDEGAIRECRRLLREGRILAVKGLGGFHLACDATNATAVSELRRRKLRIDKPFAIMMWDVETVTRHCHLSPAEEELLTSPERPIVLLARRATSDIATNVAPGQQTLGVLLPYTPLHYLLLEPETGYPDALVMTSGNYSEEPIAYSNEVARIRLPGLADAFLFHDRGIRTRCDDSVVREAPGEAPRHDDGIRPKSAKSAYFLRRSRGYVPYTVKMPWDAPSLLAAGAELKNVFCLTRERYAFVSHHIGDMENYETLQAFEDGIALLERLFRIRPEAVAYDLHPNYLATRYALDRAQREDLPSFGVQHHFAHIISCLLDNDHPGDRPVIGVSFDGTGYGDDDTIWGGEFLLTDYQGYRRVAHLAQVPLAGGDTAIREPWRMALGWLHRAGQNWSADLPTIADGQLTQEQLAAVRHQLQTGLNAPATSSMGRLFDAVASLSGVRQRVNYEAQAAVELEALVDLEERGCYPFDYEAEIVDAVPLINAIVTDLRRGAFRSVIAARFHNGVAQMVLDVSRQLRQRLGVNEVALSGGVWQNLTLLGKTLRHLSQNGFHVLIHRQVPANDAGIALGQAAAASFHMRQSGD